MSVDIGTFWCAVNKPIFVSRLVVFCYLSRERESIGYRETVVPTAACKCEWNFPPYCRSKRSSSGKIQFAARAKRRLMCGRCVVCKTEQMAPSLLCRLCSVLRGGGAFILRYKAGPRWPILLCNISYFTTILTVYGQY
jgi:hypothetical protein